MGVVSGWCRAGRGRDGRDGETAARLPGHKPGRRGRAEAERACGVYPPPPRRAPSPSTIPPVQSSRCTGGGALLDFAVALAEGGPSRGPTHLYTALTREPPFVLFTT